MEIQIKTKDILAGYGLNNSYAPDGIDVDMKPIAMNKFGIDDPFVMLSISLAASVHISVFSSWISKFFINNGRTKVSTKRREIYYDKGEVIALIEETREEER